MAAYFTCKKNARDYIARDLPHKATRRRFNNASRYSGRLEANRYTSQVTAITYILYIK